MKLNRNTQWYNHLGFYRVILLFCFIVLQPFSVQSQNIRFSSENLTLKSAFSQIEKQTGVSIDFDESVLNTSKQIRISANNKPLGETLSLLLEDTGCSYTIRGKHIIIYKTEDREITSVGGQSAKRITGTVLDERGEPVIGANVVEKGTTNGVITDIDGKFSLSISVNATLQVSYIGYLTQEIPVKDQLHFTLTLLEDLQRLNEVVVIGYG